MVRGKILQITYSRQVGRSKSLFLSKSYPLCLKRPYPLRIIYANPRKQVRGLKASQKLIKSSYKHL